MKKIFLVLGILVGLLLLILMLNKSDKVDDSLVLNTGNEDVVVSGVVTDIDLSGLMIDGPALVTLSTEDSSEQVVAVPSMGLMLCSAKEAIVDVSNLTLGDMVKVIGERDEEGRIVPCESEKHLFSKYALVRDTLAGYELSYRESPDGYVIVDTPVDTESDFVSSLTLINKEEYEEMVSSAEPREGALAISVRVYKNPDNRHSPVWVLENPRQSNIDLTIAEPEEVVVAGANAVHYVVDGLYLIDTYVVASGGFIYILEGMFSDRDSQIYTDFQDLVDSFVFVPTESPVSGKINVKVVCEGALAYMTFSSGAEADKFVAECIDGKHPEVIEKYISDMNLDGAVI